MYKRKKYLTSTEEDFSKHGPLDVAYIWNTQSKIIRITEQIFSILFFPIGIYKLLHIFAAKLVLLPASNPTLMSLYANYVDISRSFIPLKNEWKYKRLTIAVDGYKIDAVIIGKETTLDNGRWVLASNGNDEFYEDKLSYPTDFQKILIEIKSNGIIFNYPGVGSSSGLPNRHAMVKAYRAILTFLEDREKGMGAEEIIGYGHSIGAGVQAEALKTHSLQKDIKYVFVKSRTFSNISTTASLLTIKPVGFLVKCLGWNINCVNSSKKLKAPEIIIQTADVETYEKLQNSCKIIDDGIIPAEASLAKALLDNPSCPREKKLFIGIGEKHNEPLTNLSFLTKEIEHFLKTSL